MTDYKFVECRNGRHLFFQADRCLYKKNSPQYYACIEPKCGKKGKIKDRHFLFTNDNQHNHIFDHVYQVQAEIAYARMRDQALTTEMPLKMIYNGVTRTMNEEALLKIPWRNVGHVLAKIRRKQFPPTRTCNELVEVFHNNVGVREKFGEFRGQAFYRTSFTEENDEVFASIFVVQQLLVELLQEEKIWLSGDGTFSIVPLGYTQLYCILSAIKGRPRLTVIVLMTGRKQYMYDAIFEFMRDDLCLDVEVFMTDFEKPARNAIKAVWPRAQLKGCYVHFCRALTRKSNAGELGVAIRGGGDAKTAFKLYQRLAYLPRFHLQEGLNVVTAFIREGGLVTLFRPFHRYFIRTWVRRFKPHEWMVGEDETRTNNHVEALNGVLKRKIYRRPNPYDFLRDLLGVVDSIYLTFLDDSARGSVPESRSLVQEKLLRNLTRLGNDQITVAEFLHRMI